MLVDCRARGIPVRLQNFLFSSPQLVSTTALEVGRASSQSKVGVTALRDRTRGLEPDNGKSRSILAPFHSLFHAGPLGGGLPTGHWVPRKIRKIWKTRRRRICGQLLKPIIDRRSYRGYRPIGFRSSRQLHPSNRHGASLEVLGSPDKDTGGTILISWVRE